MSAPAIRVSPQVARALRVEAAKQQLGRKWLLHPANHVRKLEKPADGFQPRRQQ